MTKKELLDLISARNIPDDTQVRVITDHGQTAIKAGSVDLVYADDCYYADDWCSEEDLGDLGESYPDGIGKLTLQLLIGD